MTSLVFNAAARVVDHAGQLAGGVGVVAVVLVLFLVVERELLRTFGGPAARARVRAITPILYPLLVTFAFILGVRLGQVT